MREKKEVDKEKERKWEREGQKKSNNSNTLFFGSRLTPSRASPLEAERKRGGERKRSREREEKGDRRAENK